jgi:hypothetical protein
MITAAAEKRRAPLKIENATLNGNEIKFSLTLGTKQYQFAGRVTDDKMAGTATTPGGKAPLNWRGTRVAK